MKYTNEVYEWYVAKEFPTLDGLTPKPVRIRLVRLSGYSAISIAAVVICVLIPLVNYLKLNKQAFRLKHNWRHHFLRNRIWIDRVLFCRHQSLRSGFLWAIVGACCTFVYCNNDLVVIAKRLGRVSVAFMPPLFFLTLRPSPLPHTLYLSLLPLHKWLGRVIVLQATVHGALYIWWDLKSGNVPHLVELANIWGMLVTALFLIIVVSSLPFIRRWWFPVFYYIHYLGTWATVVLVQLHSRPPATIYTAASVAILLFQIWYRAVNTKHTTVTIVPISPCMSMMEFPMSAVAKTPILPASHVRINVYPTGLFKRVLQFAVPLQHPFTLASLPTDDTVRLIVRRSKFPLINNGKYHVTGAIDPKIDFISKPKKSRDHNSPLSSPALHPFQIRTPFLRNSPLHYIVDASRILMVVGGSAISFGLPLLNILNFNGVHVRLIWVSRDYRDLRVLSYFKCNFDGLEIYITGVTGDEQDLEIDYVDYQEAENLNVPGVKPLEQKPPLVGCIGTPELTKKGSLMATVSANYGSISRRSINKVDLQNNSSNPGTNSISPVRYQELVDHGESDGNDEVDFTELFSSKRGKGLSSLEPNTVDTFLTKESVFRKPKLIDPPEYEVFEDDLELGEDGSRNNKLTVPTGAKLYFGRPLLSPRDYHWCLQKDCVGPSETGQCCQPNNEDGLHVDDLAKVWIIAAGPQGLVNATRRWANDGGLHFHEESFSI
ncbi:putative ferric-chelate reductase Ecym_2485 [Eremothecium cymbalariae DBVPG|uniref:Ferric oxidoreductase domain-containing protein n=1 Tax=Eremothecium cymbalariae (strain CBS 270.75 / DBVPG 7215 / KCTC 17166 / NRRL Y-17582) TaxID=931890 RepID=G8JPV0_ERECY|nr:Hypothetical protein Ecym_2485 [Eremothecium cymbalariae DBVPG\